MRTTFAYLETRQIVVADERALRENDDDGRHEELQFGAKELDGGEEETLVEVSHQHTRHS